MVYPITPEKVLDKALEKLVHAHRYDPANITATEAVVRFVYHLVTTTRR